MSIWKARQHRPVVTDLPLPFTESEGLRRMRTLRLQRQGFWDLSWCINANKTIFDYSLVEWSRRLGVLLHGSTAPSPDPECDGE